MNEREAKDLTSLAFPESHGLSTDDGSLYYTFRLRHFSKLSLNATSEHTYSFGYTLFTQLKDPQSKRGYTQRAVVILSDMHPQIEFFYQLVGILASKAQEQGILKLFYDTIADTWP